MATYTMTGLFWGQGQLTLADGSVNQASDGDLHAATEDHLKVTGGEYFSKPETSISRPLQPTPPLVKLRRPAVGLELNAVSNQKDNHQGGQADGDVDEFPVRVDLGQNGERHAHEATVTVRVALAI